MRLKTKQPGQFKNVLFSLSLFLVGLTMNAQIVVTGTVTDAETNTPLPGASIVEQGTTNGTATDFDGNYSISVQNGAQLNFSYTGYSSQTISVDGRSTINVSLAISADLLDEVVVIGYGTQKRRDVTGAISSVKAEELESVPVLTLESALQGRAAGVQITQSGGVPGAPSVVKIRGISSINNDEPLYIIDGIPIQQNSQAVRTGSSPLNSINPNDIESIDILKDASAAAIYGARASAGVVVITTKRGKAGKLQVRYQGYTGINENGNARLENLMRKDQYLVYANRFMDQLDADAGEMLNRPDIFSEPAASLPDTDFYDELLQTGFMQNHNVSISGGNETSTYLVSTDYFNQRGTLRSTGLERYTLRINSDHRINKILKIGETLNISHFRRNREGRRPGAFALLENAARMSPLLPVFNPNDLGGVAQPTNEVYGHSLDNPLVFTELYDDVQNNYNLLSNIYAQVDIFDGLSFKTEVGVNFTYEDIKISNPEYASSNGGTRPSEVRNSRTQNLNLVFINSLNYNKIFGDHSVTATIAAEKVTNEFSSLSARGQNLPPTNDANQIGNVDPSTLNADGEVLDWGLLSYLGRVQYSYKNKYLLSGSLRRDGSSRLAEANRYDNFPAFSAGWRISEEGFMGDSSFLSNFMISGAYGELGNVSSLGLYSSVVPVQTGITFVTGQGAAIVNAATVQQGANRDLRWELVTSTNFGVDLGFFDNALTFEFEYFVKDTERMITSPPVPLSGGFSSIPINVGKMENKGFELSLGYENNKGDFTYSFFGNLTKIDNTLVQLDFGNNNFIAGNVTTSDIFGDAPVTRSIVGNPVGQFFGFVSDGIHQESDDFTNLYPGRQAGDYRFRDINSADAEGNPILGTPDGVVDSNDRTIIGNPLPDFTYGFTANLGYKGFDFTMFIQGSHGNDIYNLQRAIIEAPTDLWNKSSAVLNAWTPTNTNTDIPRFNVNGHQVIHSRFVEDGSYARIKNLTLGYTFPAKTSQSIGIQNLRIYGTAQNLVTITNYSGLDPEIGAEAGGALNLGIDQGNITPVPKVFIFGVQLDF